MRPSFLLVPIGLLLFAANPAQGREAAAAPRAPAAGGARATSVRRAAEVHRAADGRHIGVRPPSSAAKPRTSIRKPTAPLAELVHAAASAGTPAPGSSAPTPDGGTAGATASAGHDYGSGAPRSQPAPAPDPLPVARQAMDQLARNLQHVQRIRAKGAKDTFTADCLTEKVAEARVGVQLGDEEMARLHAGLANNDADEQAYALHRLQMLVDRASKVLDGARICAAQDPGGITATKVEVEISPVVPQGDPTAPPPPFHPVERPPAQ
jgi:hypothetical protein